MRAAWYERTGPAREVFTVGEIETPEPGPGEVRIRLHASGVNPSDVKRRGAWRGGTMEFPRIVPHSDGAGVIDAAGPAVPAARVGERVWVWNAQWRRPFGTTAEYVTLPAEQAVRLPDGTDFATGACLAIPAITAHRCLFAAGPIAGCTVLVSGGAGAVGHAAVQLAKWAGATVIVTVSSAEKAAHARTAGADRVINYRTEDVAARIDAITNGDGVDRVVEVAFGSNLPLLAAAIKPQGAIAAYGSDADPEPRLPFYQLMRKNIALHLVLMYILTDADRQRAIADITACLEAGKLRPVVAARFPLEQIAAAHEAVESGEAIGNVVVEIG